MSPDAITKPSVRWTPLLIILAVAAPVYVWGLSYYPLVWIDEVLFSEAGWNLLTEGRFVSPISLACSPTLFDGMERFHYYTPPLNGLTAAIPFALWGSSYLGLRVVTLLFGLGAVVLLYAAVSRRYDQRHALFATGALLTSPFFFVAARRYRPEMMLVFLLCGALYAVWQAQRSSRRSLWLLLAGGLLGIGMYYHYNSLVFLAVILAVLLAETWARVHWQYIAIILAGFFIALIPYLVLISADYANWVAQTQAAGDIEMSPTKLLRRLIDEPQRYRQWRAAPAAIYLAALILLSLRRGGVKSSAVIATVVYTVVLGMVATNKRGVYYLFLGAPLYALVVAMLLADITAKKPAITRSQWWYRLAGWAVAAAIVLGFIDFLARAYTYRHANYERMIANMERELEPGTMVVSDCRLWFGLHHNHEVRNIALLDCLEDNGIRVDYVVLPPRFKGHASVSCLTKLFRFCTIVREPKYDDCEIWVRKPALCASDSENGP